MFDKDKIDCPHPQYQLNQDSSDKLIEVRLAPCFALVLPSTHTVKELRMINLFISQKLGKTFSHTLYELLVHWTVFVLNGLQIHWQ